MHRKPLVAAACGAAATLVVALAGPTPAMPVSDQEQTTSVARQARRSRACGVVGVAADRHLASYTITNDKVQETGVSDRTLGYDVDAIGFYDQSSTRRKLQIRTDVVGADGVPRRLSLTMPNN